MALYIRVKKKSVINYIFCSSVKNKSLSMSDKYVSLIFNMYIIRNRMFLLNIQNDTIKCLKSCVNNLSWI